MTTTFRGRAARLVAVAAAAAVALAGSLVTASPAAADATTTITAIVRNADGTPATGARVWLRAGSLDASGNFTEEAYKASDIDTDGKVAWDVSTAFASRYAAYTLAFPSNNTFRVNGTWYDGSARVLASPGTTYDATLYNTPPRNQDVPVTLTGVPAETSVALYRWVDGQGWVFCDSDRTDGAGRVDFRAYKGGTYTLRISESATTYNQYIGGSQLAPEGPGWHGTFVTSNDETSSQTFFVHASGTMRGTVSWAGAAPTAGTVQLLRWYENGDGTGFWSPSTKVTLGADQSFAFTNLLPGESYSAVVSGLSTNAPRTHVDTWLGGSIVPPTERNDIATFVAYSGSTIDLGTVPVSTRAGSVQLQLNGFLAGRQIDVTTYDIGRGYTTSSRAKFDANTGTLTVDGLAAGQYRISASQPEGGLWNYAQAIPVTVRTDASTPLTLNASKARSTETTRASATIKGQVRVGETLVASTTLEKAPAAFAASVSYQYFWRDGHSVVATGPTLTLTPEHVHRGRYLSVLVVATAPGFTSISAFRSVRDSRPQVDPGLRPVPTTVPSVSGKAVVGKRLTANPGSWWPRPSSFTYQWLRNGTVIRGATASTYTPRRTDAGSRLQVRVTPVLAGHDVVAVTSPRTSAVPKVRASVRAKLARGTVSTRQKARVTVTVRSSGFANVTGRVTVKTGKTSRTVTLKRGHKGRVTVTLPRLKKGTHKVKVTFRGNTQHVASSAKTLKLKVR